MPVNSTFMYQKFVLHYLERAESGGSGIFEYERSVELWDTESFLEKEFEFSEGIFKYVLRSIHYGFNQDATNCDSLRTMLTR